MTKTSNQSDQQSTHTAEILHTFTELLVTFCFLVLIVTASTVLTQDLAKAYLPNGPGRLDKSATDNALNAVVYSQSLVYIFNVALRLWGSGIFYAVAAYAIGIFLGGTGKFPPSVRILVRSWLIGIAILLLVGPVVGIVFDLKAAACAQSLTYMNEEALCPLGPPLAPLLVLGSVASVIVLGVLIYAICRAHAFSLWHAIVTLIGVGVASYILTSVFNLVGLGK